MLVAVRLDASDDAAAPQDAPISLPEAIEGEIGQLKDLIAELGSIPEHLGNLSHLGDTPTSAYGGPGAPGIA